MPGLTLSDSHRSRLQQRITESSQFVSGKIEILKSWYSEQSLTKRILFAILGVIGIFLIILIIIFHAMFIKLLIIVADKWEKLPMGHLLLFLLVFFVGFPPLLGFATLSILCGMVYGVKGGWILLSTASVSGSFTSFLVFRYLLKSRAEALLKSNEKFRAFAEILKQDQSLLLLILIRLCPLPYSLSNGALASIPELPPLTYLMASILTTPKLFIHIFIGHQLKDIGDDNNTTSGRIFDTISLIITGLASALTMYLIYDKMERKLQQMHANSGTYYDENVIFGNFDDDDESGNNLELDSTEFDADNFIIDDEPIEYQHQQPQQTDIKGDFKSDIKSLDSKNLPDLPPNELDKPLPSKPSRTDPFVDGDNDFDQELDDVNTRSYRDY